MARNLSHLGAAKTKPWSMANHRLILITMAKRRRTFLNSPKLVWPVALLLAVLDGAGLYMLARGDASEAAPSAPRKAAPAPPAPVKPPPPAMIDPPPVAAVLQSGTLIVISKKSQHMFVFSDGKLWATTPVSTGKRRHETPSGFFPILQKHKLHRSNIYSGAPMPYMQRLTWTGIALHAGWVPGYPASHGCVRVPRAFAQSLFKLTNASATTVVIGDDPLETEVHAQQFALTAQLPMHSALAPPADPTRAAPTPVVLTPVELASVAVAQLRVALASAAPPPPISPASEAAISGPATVRGAQTIQLAATASPAEAEAHWARLLRAHPDLSRFEKTVEPAVVKSRRVYRLRLSAADAHGYCLKLKSDGINCINVS
jgi:lipoprotein-anchoring transpeptidase ErfK/SrfK